MNTQKAFTLVELIVVITILAILATIGFVSFSGYLAGTRDTNRIAQLKAMSDALELYTTKKDLPLPDDTVEIKAGTTTIAYQGYIGKNVLETIEYTESGLDPKDKNYFSYYLTKNKKYFQLLAFLEEPSEDVVAFNTPKNSLGLGVSATDYSDREPHVKGKKLGIIVDEDNTPLQEISAIQTAGEIDLNTSSAVVYKAIINNDEIITGSGTTLAGTHSTSSCKRIKQIKGSSDDGIYTIDPESDGTGFKVYCDMTTDGGGWTSLVHFNPSQDAGSYWSTNVGTTKDGFYNFLNKKNLFDINEVYVNKSVGWDGSEYVFEKVGNDLYARRGTLKNILIKSNWGGISGNLSNWMGNATINPKVINTIEYKWFLNCAITLNDFPFFNDHSAGNFAPNDTLFSDTPWGGRQYIDDVVVNIFVR